MQATQGAISLSPKTIRRELPGEARARTRIAARGIIASLLLAGAGRSARAAAFNEAISATVKLIQAPTEKKPLRLEIRFSIPPGMHVYSDAKHFFRIEETESQNLGPLQIELPKTREVPDAAAGKPGAVTRAFFGNAVIRVRRKATAEKGEPWTFIGAVSFQGCSETTCFMPQKVKFSFAGIIGEDSGPPKSAGTAAGAGTGPANAPPPTGAAGKNALSLDALLKRFTIVGRGVGYMHSGKFLSFLDSIERGEKNLRQQTSGGLAARFHRHGLVWIIIAILLGGLALNLTPCVLPMIPVNLAIIGAGAQGGSKLRGALLGAAYGLAIALVYGALGLLVVTTGATFGALNSSPWFNLAVAVVFVLLALAMFDIFLIDFSRFGSGVGIGAKRGSILLALFMGGISALLAGACVAPVVIAVLIFSANLYSKGDPSGLFLPFVLGLGMALPWPLAGAGMALLPKPGGWMKHVNHVLGVLILLLAGYYAWQGISLLRHREATATTPIRTGQANRAEPSRKNRPDNAAKAGEWLSSLEKAARTALDSHKPLFIDFSASWCKNCHAMEATTFRNSEVRQRLKRYVLLRFSAENPSDPATKRVLDRFSVLGLPTYVILRPNPPTARAAANPGESNPGAKPPPAAKAQTP